VLDAQGRCAVTRGLFLDCAVGPVQSIAVKSTYSISKAQSAFPSVVRESADGGAIAITRHDETVAYIVSRERMDAIVETMELLANPEAVRALKAHAEGRTRFRPLEALEREG